MWRQVRLAEPPAVDVEDAVCRVDGLARQRDDALDEVGPGRPGQWSRGGWVNTTMSPSRSWCQLKNAFCTRIRSPTSSVGTMEVVGIEKAWNANVRMPKVSASASARVMAHPASTRRRDGGARVRQAGRLPRARSPAQVIGPPKSAVVMPVTAVRCAAPPAVPRIGGPSSPPADRRAVSHRAAEAGRGWAGAVSGPRSPH